jgi:hypothetical protein
MVKITHSGGGNRKELMVTSAYLPCNSDEPPPTKGKRDVVDHCNITGRHLILFPMPIHTALYGLTQTSTREEKA